MKRLLIILFILLIVTSLYAEKERVHWAFRALQWTYYGSNYTDYALTSYVTNSGKAVEMNPIMNWYLEETELAYGIITAQNIITHFLTNWLYKHSRPLAWGMIIVFNIAKGYALYKGIQALK